MTEIRGSGKDAGGRQGGREGHGEPVVSLRAVALSAYGPTLLGSTGAGAVSPI
ncbi:MAG: hypothetical protein HOQ21_15240, partial [Dermatophilaceae bacterium]|nr:hypothetical protein [Dermatophilaceae bacterium]